MRSIALCPILFAAMVALQAQEPCYSHVPMGSIHELEDSGDELWLLSRGNGAFRYDKADETITQFSEENNGLTSNQTLDLLSYEGELLLSTDTQVFRFDGIEFQVYIEDIGGAMGITPEGRLIVSDGERYTEWEDDQLIYQLAYSSLSSLGLALSCDICDNSTDIVVSESGEIWISHFGFYEFDILRFYDGVWSVFDGQNQGLDVLPIESFDFANAIIEHEESIWATSWGGIARYTDGNWSLYHNWAFPELISNVSDTLSTSAIAMTGDTENRLWIGSAGAEWLERPSQLAMMDDEGWHIYEGLPNYDSFRVLVPSATDLNILYAGTTTGLSVIDVSCLGVNGLNRIENSDELDIQLGDGILFLGFPSPSIPRTLRIWNTLGAIVHEAQNDDGQIDIRHLKAGTYVLGVSDRGGWSSVRFIISE